MASSGPCPSKEVAVVAGRDLLSSVATNLALLQRETGLDPWLVGLGHLQAALLAKERVEVPDRDKWRVPYLEGPACLLSGSRPTTELTHWQKRNSL